MSEQNQYSALAAEHKRSADRAHKTRINNQVLADMRQFCCHDDP